MVAVCIVVAVTDLLVVCGRALSGVKQRGWARRGVRDPTNSWQTGRQTPGLEWISRSTLPMRNPYQKGPGIGNYKEPVVGGGSGCVELMAITRLSLASQKSARWDGGAPDDGEDDDGDANGDANGDADGGVRSFVGAVCLPCLPGDAKRAALAGSSVISRWGRVQNDYLRI